MLPKLAELWDARKILYFVATNHINYFDSAIIRSHRFDALTLVSPPSFSAKIGELERDELEELASHLAAILKSRTSAPRRISSQVLENALREVGDSEWRKNKSYFDFLRDTRSERRDHQMTNVPGRVGVRKSTSKE